MITENVNRAQRYHDAIRQILLKQWDPIGVGASPEAQDEYDSYVRHIYRLLISGKTVHEIFDYLWWLEAVHMGLVGDRQATERCAELLAQLRSQMS